MERDVKNSYDKLQDSGTELLEELLNFFESEASILDTNIMSSGFTVPQSSKFVSAIKFHGRPILPPVMTDERYEEMAMYKRQAIFTETRLKARTQQKLLSKVQSIVNGMNRTAPVQTRPTRLVPEVNLHTSLQTRPKSPPEIISLPSPDVLIKPVGQDGGRSSVSTSMEFKSPESKLTKDINKTKISPKSDAKDSGISSQNHVNNSATSDSSVTSDQLTDEPQDTLAGIEDFSNDDTEEAALSLTKYQIKPPVVQPKTVAQRLGSAFGVFNELRNNPPSIIQSSVRSSASCTGSTVSTDDTTLQHTVLVQDVPPTASQDGLDTTATGTVEDDITINNVKKTEDFTGCTGTGTGFEPLSSTRSLLSRVAFNLDEEESPDDGVVPKKIGDLSKIMTSEPTNSKDPMEPSMGESNISNSEHSIDNDKTGLVTGNSSNLSIGPVITPDVSQIEPAESVYDTAYNAKDDVDMNCMLKASDGTPEPQKAPQVTVKAPVSYIQHTMPVDDQSTITADMSSSPPDVTESSKSTMFTASTDIDKYMDDSNDSNMIRSSTTTLPLTNNESLSLADIGAISEPSAVHEPAIQECLAPASVQMTCQDNGAMQCMDFCQVPERMQAPTLQLTDEKTDSASQERLVRRGSYTITSPSNMLMDAPQPSTSMSSPGKAPLDLKDRVIRRGSYTLDSPSQALISSTKQINHEEKVRPKSALGINHPNPNGEEWQPINQSQAKSEPPRLNQYHLTSSMEDLKLRPVQRTLNFDDDSGSSSTQKSLVKEYQVVEPVDIAQTPQQPAALGKEEHLQRYLQTLSQMPQLPPTQTSVSDSVQSSPQTKGSDTRSPDQVASSQALTLEAAAGTALLSSGGFTDDSLSHSLQMEFEKLQNQLLEQQRQQLTQLLQEQQRQQMVMQQEFLKYESMLLESSATEQDTLLYEQLQEQQRQLLQQQMAMQQQLRWQMQQQRQQLQAQLIYLKHSQMLPTTINNNKPNILTAPVAVKRNKRKKWQDQPHEAWIIEAQSDTASITSESNTANSLAHSEKGISSNKSPSCRYFSEILQNNTHTSSNTASTLSMPTSRNTNRSGVTLNSDPFASQRSESTLSANTDIQGGKKRVSFSTDIDAASESGSVTSHRSGAVSEPIPYGHYRVGGQYFPVPCIEPLMETGESANTSILSSTTDSPSRLERAGYCQSPVSSITSSRISKTSRSSPRSPRHVVLNGPKLSIHDPVPADFQLNYDRVSAAAKGFLTRRLMRSDKVSQIIKTITDTAEFAINFQRESPIKQGQATNQDRELVERVLAQLTSALYEIHEIFFEIPVSERMSLIAQTRASEKERIFKQRAAKERGKRLSSATMKALERKKKAQAAERAVFGDLRPKSCPPATSSPRAEKTPDLSGPLRRNYQYMMSRVLKPIQAHLSPIKPVKDTLNRNPLRSSYDKLYTRAVKRAVAMEKKEQRDKAIQKQKPAMINIKNVKPKIDSHLGSKKITNNNNASNVQVPKKALSNSRPQQSHPWK